jgi:hypothetical protein
MHKAAEEDATEQQKAISVDSPQSVRLDAQLLAGTCCALRCENAVSVASFSGRAVGRTDYCALHKEPYTRALKQATFEEIQLCLLEFRDATGYASWKCANIDVRKGWDMLESYTTMVELGQCHGVYLQKLRLHGIWLGGCNLSGILPPSLAKLDTLVDLALFQNDLQGALPAHIGSPGCLPSLNTLRVSGNRELGGKIEATFLVKCGEAHTDGCHWSMYLPYLSGVSLSSADTATIFKYAPHAVVCQERVQGEVVEINWQHADYALFTSHLSPGLAARNTTWRLWQWTWLEELRKLRSQHLFVFVTDYSVDKHGKNQEGSFKSKFEDAKYVEGGEGDSDGVWKSGEEWCVAKNFDPVFGFADEGWGFAPATMGTNPLDFERRHLEAVSIKYGLPTAFVALGFDRKTGSSAQQVARPLWYPFAGCEAPLGTFVFSKQEGRLVQTGGEACTRTEDCASRWALSDRRRIGSGSE